MLEGFSARASSMSALLAFMAASAPAQSVVVDNADAGYAETGAGWTQGTVTAGKYGADYRYAQVTGLAGSPTATGSWTPTLAQAGYYYVFTQYPQGANRPPDAPFTLAGDLGTTTLRIDQRANGGAFNYLGQVHYPVGAVAGAVVVGNDCAGTVVLADAVRFDYAGQTPGPGPGTTPPDPATTSSAELRGLWVSRFEWPQPTQAATKAKLDEIMAAAQAARFNAVFLQVRGQMEALYPSPDEPWGVQFGYADPGFDPLAYAVASAHARGLELHAYINTHAIAQNTAPPVGLTPPHPYHLHGNPADPAHSDWCFVSSDGTTQPLGAGEDGYVWASPGVPEFQEWTRRQILYVARNYDVDGVHFDRIRVAGTGSYDARSLARAADPQTNPLGKNYQDWNRDQITRLLNDTYGAVAEANATRPAGKRLIKVSTAPFRGRSQQLSVNQDLLAWNFLGAEDFFAPQVYTSSLSSFEATLDTDFAVAYGRKVAAGLNRNSAGSFEVLASEIQSARDKGAFGSLTFSYSSVVADLPRLPVTVFGNAVPIPEFDWLTTPTLGILVGTVVDGAGNPVGDAKIDRQIVDPNEVNGYTWLSGADGFFAMNKILADRPVTLIASKPGVGRAQMVLSPLAAGEVRRVTVTLTDPVGRVSLDRPAYRPNSLARMTVVDDSLSATGALGVLASSAVPGDVETIALFPVAAGPGVSPGTKTALVELVGAAAASPGDGRVQVSEGTTVTVRYVDQDDGTGTGPHPRFATARIDGIAPAIVSVAVGGLTATAATVAVTASEPVTALVRASEGGCGPGTPVAAADGYHRLSHSLRLAGLAPGTTYRFAVEVADAASNGARDDGGGSCLEFTTRPLPVGLLDAFDDTATSAAWTGTGLWHPLTGDGVTSTCGGARSGANAWLYASPATCTYGTGFATSGTLTSPPFVVPTAGQLAFSSREETEGNASYDSRRVYVAPMGADGGPGTTRTLVRTGTVNSPDWYDAEPVDLSAFAGQAVFLQFEFDSVDNVANDFAGWAVDDVRVESAPGTRVERWSLYR